MTKQCSTCKIEKQTTDFYGKNKTSLRSDCKDCHKTKMKPRCKKHYENNKAIYFERNKKQRKALAEWLRDFKDNKECKDCKVRYPYWVLDFDHLRDKHKEVSKLVEYSKKKTLEEIEKCDLVCSNCHRTRTHNRRLRSLTIKQQP